MHTEYFSWWSDRLQKEMALKVYGTAGNPMLVFPTSSGRFYDFEDRGMVDSISGFIDAGKVVLYAIDSLDQESWDHPGKSPAEKVGRHEDYDRYVVCEVVPFINQRSPEPGIIITTGASMGAFHAVNFLLRHPDCFNGTIALSGIYNARYFLDNYPGDDLNVYYNSPVEYLPNLSDDWYIEKYRRSDIFICVGQGPWEDPMIHDTLRLRDTFQHKQIPAVVDLWGKDVNHDWHWWLKQFPYLLNLLLERRSSKS
ncbi:MAG: alpha/beta hydrolase-fold protein [bacterium]